jgi:hypothetical protein
MLDARRDGSCVGAECHRHTQFGAMSALSPGRTYWIAIAIAAATSCLGAQDVASTQSLLPASGALFVRKALQLLDLRLSNRLASAAGPCRFVAREW